MIDCRESRDLLQDELDGRLDAAAAARLSEHVASCAACADEKRGLASLRATFRAMPRPAAPVGFAGGVMSSLPKGRVRSLPRVLGLLVAAAAVVVVSVTLIPDSWKDASVEREVAATSPVARRATVMEKTELAPDETLIPEAQRALADGDAEADPKPAAKATPPAPAPAAPQRPSAFAAKKADEVAAPAVRYVVFRDAAAAERFAKELAAGDGWKSKDKNVEPGVVNVEPGDTGGGKGGGRADAGDARRSDGYVDMTKEAAAATRRVVARASVDAADAEATLAVEATRAGGSLVPTAETRKFAAVVEPPPLALPPAPEAATAAESKPADDARKAEATPKEAGAFSAPVKKSAPPRVVVVIVVLEPALTSPR